MIFLFFQSLKKIRSLSFEFCGRFEAIKQNADKIGIKTITGQKIYGDIVTISNRFV